MSVSVGFLKKIKQWIVDEETESIAYLPFQVDGNPYKSKVFLVGAKPEPNIQADNEDLQFFADLLTNEQLLQMLLDENEYEKTREYKGSLSFAKWMKEQWKETVVLSSINCLMSTDEQLKTLKKNKDFSYCRGFEIFEIVLNEFKPEVIVIQGATALKLFIEQFGEKLITTSKSNFARSLAELEQWGSIAKFPLNNGHLVNVIVSKSMSHFGKEGNSYGELKRHLQQLLQ